MNWKKIAESKPSDLNERVWIMDRKNYHVTISYFKKGVHPRYTHWKPLGSRPLYFRWLIFFYWFLIACIGVTAPILMYLAWPNLFFEILIFVASLVFPWSIVKGIWEAQAKIDYFRLCVKANAGEREAEEDIRLMLNEFTSDIETKM